MTSFEVKHISLSVREELYYTADFSAEIRFFTLLSLQLSHVNLDESIFTVARGASSASVSRVGAIREWKCCLFMAA